MISDFLLAAIEKSNRTQYQLAKDCGVSPIQIARFVRGQRDLRLATVDRLAETLGQEMRPARRSKV